MSQKPRGRNDPRQAWGNQSGGGGGGGGNGNGGNSRRAQPHGQNPPNFADPNAFGPPLGGRARPNRQGGGPPPNAQSQAAPSSQQPSSSAWGNQSRGPPPGGNNQGGAQAAPSAWGNQPSRSQPSNAPAPAPTNRPAAGPSAPAQAAPSAWGNQPSRAPQPSTSSGPQDGGRGQKKRPVDSASSSGDSATKYHSDEKTRGEAARGSIHGNRERPDDRRILETRPNHIAQKQGTSGSVIKIKANYFALMSPMRWETYHYHVDFSPEIETASFRNALLARQRAIIGFFLYDRGSSIFTTRKLPNDDTEIVTRDREEREILIRIRLVGVISPLENRSIQVQNIIMKKALTALSLQLVGRDHFDAAASIAIPQHNIELWPGYTTSIRQHERSLLLMAEIKHKLMRTETVLHLLQRCRHEHRDRYQQVFQQQILGMIVLTRYNNKTYRVSDVDWNITPQSQFETRNGPISYIDYYRQRPGNPIQIVDPNQPLLVVTPTERDIRGARGRDEQPQQINLVPELCTPTGYTDDMRRNFNLMKDVSNHTRVGPASRIQKLLKFNQRIQTTPASIQCFRDYGLELNRDLVTISARQLPMRLIQLGGNSTTEPRNADWTNAFQRKHSMFRSEQLKNWTLIVPNNLKRDADEFLRCIIQAAQGMRFDIGSPRSVPVQDDRTTTLSRVLTDECQGNPQLIMVAVSNNQADRYSAIKKVCFVQNAVPSQVVTRRVMDGRDCRRMLSVATKVAIQMNAKIGGLPWNVDVNMNNIMFLGFDVCHDTRDRARSYGALVATMDLRSQNTQRPSRFFSCVTPHTNGEELSNNLPLSVIKALKQYQEIHGKLPDRLLFYRDGVGEGQTNFVYEHELTHLHRALEQYYGEKPVKLAFVIVSKRINTKFFAEDRQGNAQNVPAGTVVDDVVTLPERYDFFLVSQHVNQGTATPTNYNVIFDTFGLPPDKLQQMTYIMCHLYYNWSGTVRVPAVCQYAHKLAFLVGNFLHQSPAAGLSEYLYFL